MPYCHLCGELIGHRWFPAQRQVTRSFDGSFFICAWINGWVNNCEAGNFRLHRAHNDVTVTLWLLCNSIGLRFKATQAITIIWTINVSWHEFAVHGYISSYIHIYIYNVYKYTELWLNIFAILPFHIFTLTAPLWQYCIMVIRCGWVSDHKLLDVLFSGINMVCYHHAFGVL